MHSPRELVVERDGRVVLVTLDRPSLLNAIGSTLLHQLDGVLAEVEADESVGALVVTGAGRAFSAGADITEFHALQDAAAFRAWIQRFSTTYERLERLPCPTVAAVDGPALGGGFELVLACDLRVVSTRATFGLPEVKLGLLPGGGGTQRLVRQLPPALARAIVLGGDPIPADVAERVGLVNAVVGDGEALDAARAWAQRLAALPRGALSVGKQLLRDGVALPLEAAITLEREAVAHLFTSPDAREGVRAFLEKRTPVFNAVVSEASTEGSS
jgi:enoyl-CoA hydratase